jgi:2,3-bisphosphoglycerate-independent phosphoglycerate mutase
LVALQVVDGCSHPDRRAASPRSTPTTDAPGACSITADRSNAAAARRRGRPVTAPPPAGALRPVGSAARGVALTDGVLADVAPTLLELAGLPRWAEMTGRSRIL